MYPFQYPFPKRIVVALVVFLCAQFSQANEWISVPISTSTDFKKIHFFDGHFFAIGTSEIFCSYDAQTWTSVNLPSGFTIASTAETPKGLLAAGESDGAATLLFSEDGIEWIAFESQIEAESPIVQTEYAIGRYWLVLKNGNLLSSIDAETWNLTYPNTSGLQSFGDRLVTILNNGLLQTFYNEQDGRIRPDLQTNFDLPAIAMAAGSDRAVAVLRSAEEFAFAISGDGIIWLAVEHDFQSLDQISYAAGRFWATGEGTIFSSTDGARWAERSAGLDGTHLRSIASGNGIVVGVGDDGAIVFREIGTISPVILQQSETEITLPNGDPLHLAIEVEALENTSIRWQRDGIDLENRAGPLLRIPSVSAADAGSYRASVEQPGHSPILSEFFKVTVTDEKPHPVSWEPVATLKGNFSRLAVNDSAIFALGHTRSFSESFFNNRGIQPAAWSADGVFWHAATFGDVASSSGWIALGSVSGEFWLGNESGGQIAFSTDGLAWREVKLPTSAPVTLVGEHQGKRFAAAGSLFFEQPNGEWLSESLPENRASDYFSDGDRFLIVSSFGIWEWKNNMVRQLKSAGPFPFRFLRGADRFLMLPRQAAPDFPPETFTTLSISGDGEFWTDISGQLPDTRDGLYAGDNFWAVGKGFAKSSSDGVWWSDRSAGIGSTTISAIAAGDHFLYIAGDDGKVFRRPIQVDPVFIQHPVSAEITAGQSVRFVGRTSDNSEIEFQWHHDGSPLPGETGPILEIRAAGLETAGSYTLEAIGQNGSFFSETAILSVSEEPIRYPLQEIGRIPHNTPLGHPSYLRNIHRIGENIVAASHTSPLIALSRDGISWIITSPAPGSSHSRSLTKIDDQLFLFQWDHHLKSTDGLIWEAAPEIPSRTLKLVKANGLFVAAGEKGLFRSTNGIDWTALDINEDLSFLANDNTRWIAAGRTASVFISIDGHNWKSHKLPSGVRSIEAIAAGHGIILVLTSGSNGYEIHRSKNGSAWETAKVAHSARSLRFEDGFFWKSGSGGLYVSADGRSWAHRATDIAGWPDAEFLDSDEFEMRYLIEKRIFRKPMPIRPVFYKPSLTATPGFPGDTYQLHSPAHHGDESVFYIWKRNDELIPDVAGPTLTFTDFDAADAGSYTAEVISPFGSDTTTVFAHFIGNFSSWASRYRQGYPEDDPGGFGIPNLLRYGFHLDALSPDRALLPKVTYETTDSTTSTILRFQLLGGISDIAWICETSTDLITWMETDAWTLESDERIESTRYLKLRFPESTDSEKAFYRIRLNLGTP